MTQEQREARLRENSPVELILMRHGEPDWERKGETGDPGLTPLGRTQASRSATALERPIHAIYCSPLSRARETAGEVCAAHELAPQVVDGLEEIQAPLLSKLTQTEVDSYFAAAARRPLEDWWTGFPGGESFKDFHKRVTAAIESVLSHHGIHPRASGEFTIWSSPARGQAMRIVVVGHGGANAVMLTHLLGLPPVPWEWLRFETPLAALTTLSLRGIGDERYLWSLQRFGWRA